MSSATMYAHREAPWSVKNGTFIADSQVSFVPTALPPLSPTALSYRSLLPLPPSPRASSPALVSRVCLASVSVSVSVSVSISVCVCVMCTVSNPRPRNANENMRMRHVLELCRCHV